jgi:hypothetical protein
MYNNLHFHDDFSLFLFGNGSVICVCVCAVFAVPLLNILFDKLVWRNSHTMDYFPSTSIWYRCVYAAPIYSMVIYLFSFITTPKKRAILCAICVFLLFGNYQIVIIRIIYDRSGYNTIQIDDGACTFCTFISRILFSWHEFDFVFCRP